MCGIAGIVKFDARDEVSEGRLRNMRDSLIHRGPDEAGLMINGAAGFAHRRLSIIDIGGGHQPMTNRDRSNWITFNGEIYNYRALRTELQARGSRFATESDTEVVLCAYEAFGEDCVLHFEGMFAFAIWDANRERLFMARDRLGIKPFYYRISGTEILFASEIKAILAASEAPSLNRAILPEFLASRYVAGNETFFENIHKLQPGCRLTWSRLQGFRGDCYWQPPVATNDTSFSRKDYVEQVRAGLKDAVRSHLVSDVPVGLFLSGGLDSSALAGLMAPMVDGPIHTFSVGFNEAAANELHYARLSAAAIGAHHREVVVSPEQYFAALPQMIWHEDEPIAFTSSVPLYILSRLAQQHVKVVLTGEGADELFLGYDYRYRVTALNQKLGAIYNDLLPEGARHGIAGLVPSLPRSLRRYAERTFLALGTNPRALFCENFSVFRGRERQRILLDQDLLCDRDPHADRMRHYHAAGIEPLHCMSRADLKTYLVELLMKQDQMSMAASIESRVPYLDHRLVELVSRIPARFKMRGWQTKALLRDAVRDVVPRAIMTRKKMGFPVPVNAWLRGQYWPLVEDFVLGDRACARGHFNRSELMRLTQEHRSGTADHGERLWLLINLEMWQRIFIEGEMPSAIYVNNPRKTRAFMNDRYQPGVATAHQVLL